MDSRERGFWIATETLFRERWWPAPVPFGHALRPALVGSDGIDDQSLEEVMLLRIMWSEERRGEHG